MEQDTGARALAAELLAQLLRDRGRSPGQVILSETHSQSMGHKERGKDISLIVLAKARGEVVRQYREVALRKFRLEEVFGNLDGLDLNIQEWEAIQDCFTGCGIESGWETFHKRFPRTRAIMAVSCPAFTLDFSQAMIECTSIGALGECCLYQQEGGAWKLVEQKCLWIA